MSTLLRAQELHNAIHNKGWAREQPNTETLGHAQDQPENAEMNVNGKHRHTRHLIQNYDWSNIPFTYKWNSLGLRGPEPNFNASRKLMVVGNSMSLGQGVPLESSYAYMLSQDLNMDYVNLSEYFVLSDSMDRLEELKEYKPNIMLIATGRFFTGLDMMVNYSMLQLDNFNDEAIKNNAESVIKSTNGTLLRMFELAIQQLYPHTKIFWITNHIDTNRPRDPFSGNDVWKNIQNPIIEIKPRKDYIDLGRDNLHPGIKSHILFKEKIKTVVNSTDF